MSWMKNFRTQLTAAALSCCYIVGAFIVVETAYHHYQEEHAQVKSTGWTPPKIVKHENCALWDEIRQECEDD